MAVPDYQTLMAPTLRALQDLQMRSASEIRLIVAAEVGITDDDLREVIKSGLPVFSSRVNWALIYMVQAGLIRRPRRGVLQVTERGEAVLRDHADRVDNHVLQEFEEFREFTSRARRAKPTIPPEAPPPTTGVDPGLAVTGTPKKSSSQRSMRTTPPSLPNCWPAS